VGLQSIRTALARGATFFFHFGTKYRFKKRKIFITHNRTLRIITFYYTSKKMQRYTVYFIWKLLYMFRVVPPPIIRSANNCIHCIWYLSHRYCYQPLSWRCWNRFECAVVGVRHPQHTQTGSNTFKIAAGSSKGETNTRCRRYICLRS
jgi:hypothetical protein